DGAAVCGAMENVIADGAQTKQRGNAGPRNRSGVSRSTGAIASRVVGTQRGNGRFKEPMSSIRLPRGKIGLQFLVEFRGAPISLFGISSATKVLQQARVFVLSFGLLTPVKVVSRIVGSEFVEFGNGAAVDGLSFRPSAVRCHRIG